jgi:hypothetical protein
MKRLANIMAILLVVVGCSFGYAHGGSEDPGLTKVQLYTLDLINKIRSDPLSYAETLGYDRNVLIAGLPWLADSFKNGLPLCEINADLNARAEISNSIDESLLGFQAEPVSGCDYSFTGEMGGVVSFLNFMPAEFACKIIVVNQFKQELDPNRIAKRYLLNPGFDSVGVSTRGGVQSVDGARKNAYFATISFASSRLKSEVQVLNMINQVRHNPMDALKYLGISMMDVRNQNWNIVHSLRSPQFDPLMDSSSLHGSVQNYSKQIAWNGGVNTLLQDDSSLMRAANSGYAGVLLKEVVSEAVHPYGDETPIASQIFSLMMQKEFNALPEDSVVFSRVGADAGVGISFVHGIEYMLSIATLDVGKPVVDESIVPVESKVYGVVYSDRDGNGIYSPGEEAEHVSVIVYRKTDGCIMKKIFADNAGHFSMNVPVNQEYRVDVSSGETMVSLEVLLDRDSFWPIALPLPSLAPPE